MLWGGIMLLLAPSCSDGYDDSDLRNEMLELAGRIEKLEEQARELNLHLLTLEDFIHVMQGSLHIAKVETVADGHIIYFTDGGQIHLGQGEAGRDAPTIGVAPDTDGIYYWTITSDGKTEWLTGENGGKLRVTAVTPTLGVDEQGFWTISYDGGKTATRILGADGKPVAALGGVFEEIEVDGAWLHITLSGGETVSVPIRSDFYLLIPDAPALAEFAYGQTRTFAVERVGVERVVLTKPDEWRVALEDNTLTITAPGQEHAGCAELEGAVSIIYFSASHLSSVLSLNVGVGAPKTIRIAVTDKGLLDDGATISAALTPSDNELLYYFGEYKAGHYDDSDTQGPLTDLTASINMFVGAQGWESAAQSLFAQGPKEYTAKWLAEDTDYYLVAFGVRKEVVEGRETAVATTPLFRSEKVRTPASAAQAIDLSAGGTANSYIVNQPSTRYKFKATAMGNGAATTGIVPAPIQPALAFVLWETGRVKNALVRDVELTADGYVLFTTGERMDGNALIAVTDNVPVTGDVQLALGTVLWSWHIWATDYTPQMDKRCVNSEARHYTIMDRNLGDWSDRNISYNGGYWGLKYQWGRKDPFVGFSGGSPVEQASITHHEDYIWQAAAMPALDNDAQSLLYAVRFPSVFFKGGYANSNDWYGAGLGDEHRNNNLWGNADGTTAAKTIYDPCPPGYRVAPIDAFSGFFKTGLGSITVSAENLNVSGAFDQGWNFLTEGTDHSFFPAQGSLTGSTSSGSKFGMTGIYFSSNPSTGISTSTQIRGMRVESPSCMLPTMNRSDGASVRCVRE